MSKEPITKAAAMKWQHWVFGALVVVVQSAYGQPVIPKFESYQPINIKTGAFQTTPPFTFQQNNPLLPDDSYREQNYRIMQQAGMTLPGLPNNRRQSAEEVREALNEEKKGLQTDSYGMSLKTFQNNLRQFLTLNPDSFSITKAVYLSESAYYGNNVLPPYELFEIAVKKRAELVRQILKREGLNEKDDLAVNYAIQKLYTQDNVFHDSVSGADLPIKKIRYDFEDYMGDKDWTKMFVTKLLHTGSGQCHSLPLHYLCIVEQFHIKAYLSLAPNHSFIQYFDRKGNRFNFEATNGNLVSQTWLAQNSFVNAIALKNKTYLDTLSSRKLYAQCLGDLLLSYLMKMKHYDDFSDQLIKNILIIDSTNLIALMELANLRNIIFQYELRAAGNPPQNEYIHYSGLYTAYKEFEAIRQRVKLTGFQEMPKEAYQQWLKSLEYEKQIQQNQLEQERMEYEIKKLKNMRSKLINKTES